MGWSDGKHGAMEWDRPYRVMQLVRLQLLNQFRGNPNRRRKLYLQGTLAVVLFGSLASNPAAAHARQRLLHSVLCREPRRQLHRDTQLRILRSR